MNKRAFVATIALAVLLTACGSSKSSTTAGTSGDTTATSGAGAAATVKTGTTAKVGTVLVNAAGRTLYMFDPENSGTIVCTASCTGLWPPLVVTGQPVAGSGVSGLATVSRPDGATQVTFNGHPLYTYNNDKASGDANGDGVGGVWHAAKPGPSTAAATTTSGGYTYG